MLVFLQPVSPLLMFSWAAVPFRSGGCCLLYCFRSVLLAIIVEKSKKCLDFGVTLFLIHWVMCWMYDGFPTVLDWWIVNLFGMIVMVLLGEYLCSRRELDDIPLLQL